MDVFGDLDPEELEHIASGPLDAALQTIVFQLRTHLIGAMATVECLEQTHPELDEAAKKLLTATKANHARMAELITNQAVGVLLPRLRGESTSNSGDQGSKPDDYRDESEEEWPNHHLKLRERVATAIAFEPDGTIVCAMESFSPRGSRDEMWLVLTQSEGFVSRVYAPYLQGARVHNAQRLDANESSVICTKLKHLGVWDLPHLKPSNLNLLVFDGWCCAIAISDGNRLHSIQMHNPGGRHLQLVEYIRELLPLP